MWPRVVILGLLTGCFVGYPTRVQVAGTPGSVPIAQRGSAVQQALTQQASRDLGCPRVTISENADLLRAAGCAKHAMYLELMDDVGDLETVTFVNLETASVDMPILASRSESQALVRTNQDAAKDLGCDRSEVIPELISLGPRSGMVQPVAVGCGHRATYLPIRLYSGAPRDPLRLSSRVDAPPSASQLEPWNP